jgi:hypothetical protein
MGRLEGGYSMKRFIILAAVSVLLAVPVASAATPTVAVNPASPVWGQSYTISGCGYPVGTNLFVQLHEPNYTIPSQTVTTDATGCFTSTWTADAVGSYHADVLLPAAQGAKKFRLTTLASVDYIVTFS